MGNKHSKLTFFQKQKKKATQTSMSTQTDKQTQEQDMLQDVQVQAERQLTTLNTHMMTIEEALQKKQAEAEKQQAKVKELIAHGRKVDAKREVFHLKQLNTELALIHTRKMVLLKQKNQLDMANIDTGMTGVLDKGNKFMKETDQIYEKMTDVMLDQREIEANRAEVNDMFAQMTEDSRQDEENLFKELEKEVNEKTPSVILNAVLPQRLPLQQLAFEQPIQPSLDKINIVISKARHSKNSTNAIKQLIL